MTLPLLAARNILGEDQDPWKANLDVEYHEDTRDGHSAVRTVPGHAAPSPQ